MDGERVGARDVWEEWSHEVWLHMCVDQASA